MTNPQDILNRMFHTQNSSLIYPKTEETNTQDFTEILQTNIFNVMLNRRSQRKFLDKNIEDWKIEIILAAADTAPTAGGFQGFEIYHIKNPSLKKQLVVAANNQPYVNSPLILVFCKNPKRVKLTFPEEILRKFSIQDATLAAGYSQLAAHALGLSSIWIGMIDEEKISQLLETDLIPSSILCIGYPEKILLPKPKRNLKDLIHEI